MAEELKACRNCGGQCDPKGWMRGDGRQGPECEGCGITTPDVESWNRLMGAQLPSQGGEAVEVIAMYDKNAASSADAFRWPSMAQGQSWREPVMTVAQHQRILAASLAQKSDPVCSECNGLSVVIDDHVLPCPKCNAYPHPADQVAEGTRAVRVDLLERLAHYLECSSNLTEKDYGDEGYGHAAELRALLGVKP